jgi:DNA-binding transcriptional ArsR family regulator
MDFLKALADETRLSIIEYLKDGEKCACNIVPYTKKSQPNVSLHLKKLEEAGILKSRKDGTKILYHIEDPRVIRIFEILK